jgi:hypothetical protein
MANQITINIGAAANDGTGDPLRTAFNDVNLNFANVWSTGLPNSNVQFSDNRILTTNTNANLVFAPNGIAKVVSNVSILPNLSNVHDLGSSTNRWNTLYAQYLNISNDIAFGDLTVNGNLTVTGNIIEIGNIITDAKTIQLANTASTANAANGSGITVGASDNIATLLYSNTANAWTTNIGLNITGNILPSANITYNLGSNTAQWKDLWVSNSTIYMNSVPITLSAGNVLTVNGNAVLTNNSNTTVSTTGNVTANYFFGNGSQLTGLAATYGNANVVANLAAFGSNPISTTGNITSGNLLTGKVTNSANITLTAGSNVWTFGTNSDLTFPIGNSKIRNGYPGSAGGSGDGSSWFVTSTSGGGVASPDGKQYIQVDNVGLFIGSNFTANTGYAWTFGTDGILSATGNITTTANISGSNITTGGLISAAGNITGGNITTAGVLKISGSSAYIDVAGTGFIQNAGAGEMQISTVANRPLIINTNAGAYGWNFGTAGNLTLPNGGTVSGTGNITAGNLITSGLISASGNVTGGNVITNTLVGTGLTLRSTGDLTLSATGNINANNEYINNIPLPVQDGDAANKLYVDNFVSGLNIHDAVKAATPNTLANITSGTITYNNGTNGVGATLTTTGAFNLIDTVNVQTSGTRILVLNEANAVTNGIYVWSNATAITRATDYNTVPEVEAGDFMFVTNGNVYGNTGWVQTSTISNIGVAGNNITFTQFSGAATYNAGTGLTLSGTTFSVNASQTQITSVGTLTSLSVTGNTTGGNILTGGQVSATGNVDAGNLTVGSGTITGGNVNGSIFNGNVAFGTGTVGGSGNITGGNLLFGSGVVSGTGNVSAGNLNVTGNIVDSGALTIITGSNGNIALAPNGTGIVTASGNISAVGNVTGGNLLTGGLISATANITGGNILFGTGIVSGTGNITGGNILTGGLISATANITGGNLTTAALTSTASLSITGNTATVTSSNYAIGYRDIPQVSLSSNVTTALTDAGKHYYSVSASNLALTIANNSSVVWPVGAAISIVNRGTANITVAGGTGVSLYLAGNSTAGNRTVTTYGMATVMNVAANIWMISGTVV